MGSNKHFILKLGLRTYLDSRLLFGSTVTIYQELLELKLLKISVYIYLNTIILI
jgi:hypothetical protein